MCARELAASLAALCHSFAGPIGAMHRTFQGGPAGSRAGRTFRTERVASDQKVPTGRLLASAGNTPTDRHRGARTRRDRERSPSSEVGLAG
jgi:hypothetical protein